MECHNCGADIADDAMFCTQCGTNQTPSEKLASAPSSIMDVNEEERCEAEPKRTAEEERRIAEEVAERKAEEQKKSKLAEETKSRMTERSKNSDMEVVYRINGELKRIELEISQNTTCLTEIEAHMIEINDKINNKLLIISVATCISAGVMGTAFLYALNVVHKFSSFGNMFR